MIKRISAVIAALLMLLLAPACDSKPHSVGNIDEIIVFADSTDWIEFEEPLKSVFSKLYRTPVLEPEYLLKHRTMDQFAAYERHKNVLLLARLDSKLPVSQFVTPILPQEVISRVNSGDAFYIPQEDNWALDQYVLFLLAPTREEMIQRIYDLGDLIYDDFSASYYERIRERMFLRYENTELGEYLLRHFPFTLRIQADFINVDESVEGRFVWLRRLHPDRSLVVHWIPYRDGIEIDFDWIADMRDSLAARVLSRDVVVREETTLEQVKFQRWEGAYRMEGTWMNPELYIGGPFRNITFVDRKSGLIFMIDFHVQAVGERKKLYLDQLDIMAHTFEARSYIETEAQ